MRKPTSLIALAILAWPLFAAPGIAADAPAWSLVAGKSRIQFTGVQMRVPSKGEFKRFDADIRFDPGNLEGSKVTVTVETGSAATGNDDIDKELKKELWFEVAKYPKATFVVSRFVSKEDGSYDAVARLTIRDRTKDVTLPFKLSISGKTAKLSGSLKLNRLDFGIGRGEWKDTSIVANEVSVRIEIEATRE